MSRKTWQSAVEFTLINFATPIAFYVTFRLWGPKPAIAFAIATSVVQFAVHKIQRIPLGPFFLVASGFTVFFGSIDLLIASPRFFRLEPAIHNLVVGAVFLYSSFTRRPILVWFAEGLPPWARPTPSELQSRYLTRVTRVWGVYQLIKAGIYLYLAFNVDLGTLIVLRSVIGGASIVLLVLGEVAYRKWSRVMGSEQE